MLTERELLILDFAMCKIVNERPAAFFKHVEADALLAKVQGAIHTTRKADPSPELIQAAKVQWAREAKEREANLCGCGSGKRFLECDCSK